MIVPTTAHNPEVVGSSPSPATISSVHNGFELWTLAFCCITGDTGLLRLVPPALFRYAGSGAGACAGTGIGRYSTATP